MKSKNKFDGDGRPRVTSVKIKSPSTPLQRYYTVQFVTDNHYEDYENSIENKPIILSVSELGINTEETSYPYIEGAYTRIDTGTFGFQCRVYDHSTSAYNSIKQLIEAEPLPALNVHIDYREAKQLEIFRNRPLSHIE